ncbi:hypothetical protein I7I53_07408 [Histoplasma capsulatum var. duboisii H88]|uniref:Uncharacterized protein n=1 Tax=Ajellomyces capsulatus (strain H88) TaxID=544711 RepID=A0A8A1LEF9_AJEC8|nr:hypothetical protein I7I53_07408 [Histoplasma capsulatum var. duboisii H88]
MVICPQLNWKGFGGRLEMDNQLDKFKIHTLFSGNIHYFHSSSNATGAHVGQVYKLTGRRVATWEEKEAIHGNHPQTNVLQNMHILN